MRKKGGNLFNGLSAATSSVIVPFGLLYAQKKLQKTKKIHHINDLYKKHSTLRNRLPPRFKSRIHKPNRSYRHRGKAP